ncbi:MAG: lytic transglycosylase domain-containing protein [Thiohalocapsa sp.]
MSVTGPKPRPYVNRLAGLGLSVFLAAASPLAWTLEDGAKGRKVVSNDPVSVDDAAASRPKDEVKVLPHPPTKPKPSRTTVNKYINRYAKRYGVEGDLVHSVVRAESAYNAHAVSPAGAVGLMQIMPATGADYGVGSVDALFDAETNIRIGVRHLKRLVGRYGIGKAVMAYNAGEGALASHNGFVTYPETQRYTHRVLTSYLQKKGVRPYSGKAREITGITLTPAMSSAGGSSTKGRRLLRRVDLSTLSLRVRPSLSDRALDPAAHRVGPESKPMFVLDPAGSDR